jgi:hypothetical protein
MNNLEFDFGDKCYELNKCLDPQPPQYSDCIEDYNELGHFKFYKGSSMEGHYCVAEIQTTNLSIEPFFDNIKKLWVWSSLSEQTKSFRNWRNNLNRV